MKAILLFFIASLLTTGIYAQVGIGNESPRGLLDVNDNQNGDASTGLVLPHTNNPAQLQNPQTGEASDVPGTIAYDSEEDCIKFIKNDNTWSDCIAASGGGVTPPPNLPPNIILRGNQTHFIVSADDTDYLPFTASTSGASTDTDVAVDGTADTPALDVQGTLTTTGITIRIPYTVTTAAVTLPAFSQTIEVPANLTEDNTARMVEFSYPEMTYQVGDGFVEATLRSTGGDLNAEKLDLQAGLGSDFLGVLMATFVYATNDMGGTGNVFLRDIPGIPDRNINDANHRFIYKPVTGEDGDLWLSNNLGAKYTQIGHTAFDPNQQATSRTDINASGSLFQWGRQGDGHELITYTSATAPGTAENTPNLTARNDNPPNNSSFILPTGLTNPPAGNIIFTRRWDWRVNGDDNLWNGEAAANNPCPIGYKVPSSGDWGTLNALFPVEHSSLEVRIPLGSGSSLRLSGSGLRFLNSNTTDFISPPGGGGRFYWSSSTDTNNALSAIAINPVIAGQGLGGLNSQSEILNRNLARGSGAAVRCIAD